MKLTNKLYKIKEDVIGTHVKPRLEDAFNRCIDDVHDLEEKAKKYDDLIKVITAEQYNEDGTENMDGDLLTIGEAVLNHLDMWM